MVQNTTHQPRNGISQVFSQDPCQLRGCLDDLSIVRIRVPVGSQDLKAVSLKEPIICLLSPPRGIVSRAKGLLRSKCTNSQLLLSICFFFLPAPCALEALTVINTFCFD